MSFSRLWGGTDESNLQTFSIWKASLPIAPLDSPKEEENGLIRRAMSCHVLSERKGLVMSCLGAALRTQTRGVKCYHLTHHRFIRNARLGRVGYYA